MRWSRCANAVRGGDPGCRAARLEHTRDERNGISGGTEPARNGRTAQDHLLHHGKRTWSYHASGRGWPRLICDEPLGSVSVGDHAAVCRRDRKDTATDTSQTTSSIYPFFPRLPVRTLNLLCFFLVTKRS